MKLLKLLRKLLPHLVLAFMVCINVLQVMHMYNPSYRFMTSKPSVVLITAGTVLAIILSAADMVRDSRQSK